MANLSAIRTDWHAEHRHKELTDMNTSLSGIARWVRIVIMSVALTLATSQVVGAETQRPNVDSGGPGGGTAAANATLPDFVVNPNLRSIQMIESKEASVTLVDESSVPDFVVRPNLRSIQLIEGKQAAIAVAQPASSSTAFSVCLACATLG